jgi:hypothetical protein
MGSGAGGVDVAFGIERAAEAVITLETVTARTRRCAPYAG